MSKLSSSAIVEDLFAERAFDYRCLCGASRSGKLTDVCLCLEQTISKEEHVKVTGRDLRLAQR